jgi:tetratricopeptide (TPR) repeat protein
MTFVRRRLQQSNVISEASEMLREGRALEAIDLLCFALRAEPGNPDYYWLRGRAHWNLAFPDADPDRYRQALRDFEEAASMDPSMILNHGSLWPEQEWALPAYKQLLGHEDLHVRRRANKVIGVIGWEIPGIVESLLDAMRLEGNYWPKRMCPYRNTLRLLNWAYTTEDGDLLITQDDLTTEGAGTLRPRPDPTRTDLVVEQYESASSMLEDRSLYDSEDEYDESNEELRKEMDFDDQRLLARLDDRRPLVRARAIAILTTRKPPYLFERVGACVKDRHRSVRTMALHAVVAVATSGGQSGAPIACLAEAARKDKAYPCRAVAVEGIGRVIAGLRPGDGDLLESLLEVLADLLADKNKNIVGRAVVGIGIAGAEASRLLKCIDEIDFSENGEYIGNGVEWTCQKARTVFLISQPGDPLRDKNWDVLCRALRSPNCFFRHIAVKHVGFIARSDVSMKPSAVKHLVERAMMDDYKIVRQLASEALSSLTGNPLGFAEPGTWKLQKDR